MSRFRQLSRKSMRVVCYFAILISLYHIVYVSGLVGGGFSRPCFRAISLALILGLTFLLVPHTQKKVVTNVPWYDVVLIFFSMVPALYYGLAYNTIITQLGYATLLQQVLGILLVIAVLEAVRRVTTWVLTLLCALFFLYPLTLSYSLPGFLHGDNYSLARVIGQIYLFPEGMLGILLDITASIIVMFIIFGSLLEVSGGSNAFIDIARSITGKMKAGPALSAIAASALIGTVSGSGVANTATTGVVTIPLMKKMGLSPHFAGATEAVASTGGQIMPPVMGAAAFIMCHFLGMPYYQLCIAAAIPAFLYFFSLALGVIFEANKVLVSSELSKGKILSFWQVIAKAWIYFIPLLVLIYFLVGPRLTPDICVFYALISLVMIILVKMGLKKESRHPARIMATFAEGLSRGSYGMVTLMAPVVGAGIIMGSLSLTGLGLTLSSNLVTLSGGNLLPLALLAALASIVLGMGLPTIACYIMVALLIAPAFGQLGVEPIAAHMFIFYFALASMITPPVCLTVYVGASIAGADMMKTGLTAMRLGIGAYLIPFVFLLNPAIFLVVGGSIVSSLVALSMACIGLVLVCSGLSGQLTNTMVFNPFQRGLLFIAGVALMLNLGAVVLVNSAAIALAVIVLIWGFLTKLRSL